MKKLEKELLLLDLENANMDYDRKRKKLETIIVFYLDEEKENDDNNDIKDDEVKKEENKDNEDNQQKDIDKEDADNKGNGDDVDDDKKTEQEDLHRNKKEDLLPPDIKTLYRKIMMKTHPDKTKGKPYEEKYQEYYKQAVNAKNENDKAELLFIGYKLNIKEIFDIDDNHFGNVRFKIKTLEMKSTQIDNNPFWVWYHSQNKQLRNIMIQQITKMRTGGKK